MTAEGREYAWLDHGTTKSGDGRGIPLNADAVAALEATRGQNPRRCFTFAGKRIQQSSTAWGLAKPDNRVLECAATGNADVIVTGDRAMLNLKKYQEVRILSLRQFLDEISIADS